MSTKINTLNKCCLKDCNAIAEWAIFYGNGLDDYTHSCTEHVGNLLEDVDSQIIYKMDMYDEETAN
jgi:hypothetical protein